MKTMPMQGPLGLNCLTAKKSAFTILVQLTSGIYILKIEMNKMRIAISQNHLILI